MITADPRQHLKVGTRDRRCWTCGRWTQPEHWPDGAQPLGDCGKVDWTPPDGHRQMTHADDVCAKHEPVARTLDEREEMALAAGLG